MCCKIQPCRRLAWVGLGWSCMCGFSWGVGMVGMFKLKFKKYLILYRSETQLQPKMFQKTQFSLPQPSNIGSFTFLFGAQVVRRAAKRACRVITQWMWRMLPYKPLPRHENDGSRGQHSITSIVLFSLLSW